MTACQWATASRAFAHVGSMSTRPLKRRRLMSSASAAEVDHFSRLSAKFWDETGEFKLLHRMNEARMEFLDQQTQAGGSLSGRSVLDVGCGGGLFSECLARRGANTLGIDASASNIAIAEAHALQDPRFTTQVASARQWRLKYRAALAEDILKEAPQERYDIVCAMEVIEHVDHPRDFLRTLGTLTKPGGHLILSTISRTLLAQVLTIGIAENPLFGFVTPGTHTFKKYIKPEEMRSFLVNEMCWNASEVNIRGVQYLPWTGRWHLSSPRSSNLLKGWDTLSNYFIGVQKPI